MTRPAVPPPTLDEPDPGMAHFAEMEERKDGLGEDSPNAATANAGPAPETEPGLEPDFGPELDADSGPERRCVATGEVGPKDALYRFVLDPDGRLVPDLDSRLPGRGLYLTPSVEAFAIAAKRRSFARAARRPVEVPDELVALVERLSARRVAHLLGLARRAGQAVIGYDQAEAWLRAGKAAILVQAADAAEGGRAKLKGLATGARAREWSVLTAAELSEPFGRDHLVHVAVARGGIAEKLKIELARLARLRLPKFQQEVATA